MPPTPLWLMPRENEKTPTLFIWVLLSFHCLQKSGRIRARRGGNARHFFFGMSEAHFLEFFHGGVSFLNKLSSFFNCLQKNCKILAATGGECPPFFFWCLNFAYLFAKQFGDCFVTNEVPWRFQKLSMPRFEPHQWDLQFGTGPGSSRAQKIRKIYEIL